MLTHTHDTTQYTLPKMPRPMRRRGTRRRATAAGAGAGAEGEQDQGQGQEEEPSATVVVRSLRNPPLDVRLAARPLRTTSLLDVKAAVAAAAGLPADRLRLLYRRRPVPDSKVLGDLLPPGGGEEAGGGSPSANTTTTTTTTIEFSVVVMGGAAGAIGGMGIPTETGSGAATKDKAAAAAAAIAHGVGAGGVPGSPAFWDDLRGFLLQRVRDEKLAGELAVTFQAAWEARR